MASELTDESLADAERYCREGMIERPLLALRPRLGAGMSEALLAVVVELRERRAADLTAEEVEALAWLRDQQNGTLTMANRVGAAEGECDADGNELPGDWVPTPGGVALRAIDKLIAGHDKEHSNG